jgi:hypothetical protein
MKIWAIEESLLKWHGSMEYGRWGWSRWTILPKTASTTRQTAREILSELRAKDFFGQSKLRICRLERATHDLR